MEKIVQVHHRPGAETVVLHGLEKVSPKFFFSGFILISFFLFRPFRLYREEINRLSWEKVGDLKPDMIYAEGNLEGFLKQSGIGRTNVLYFGDHMYSDLAVSLVGMKIAHSGINFPFLGAHAQIGLANRRYRPRIGEGDRNSKYGSLSILDILARLSNMADRTIRGRCSWIARIRRRTPNLARRTAGFDASIEIDVQSTIRIDISHFPSSDIFFQKTYAIGRYLHVEIAKFASVQRRPHILSETVRFGARGSRRRAQYGSPVECFSSGGFHWCVGGGGYSR